MDNMVYLKDRIRDVAKCWGGKKTSYGEQEELEIVTERHLCLEHFADGAAQDLLENL